MKILFISLIASLFSFAPIAAAETPATAAPEQSLVQTLVMVGIALLFFYFILWRPEQKRRKSMDELRNGMKKGDRVTAMGILGTISKIKEQSVIVKMVDGNEIEFLKAAITEIHPASEPAKE